MIFVEGRLLAGGLSHFARETAANKECLPDVDARRNRSPRQD